MKRSHYFILAIIVCSSLLFVNCKTMTNSGLSENEIFLEGASEVDVKNILETLGLNKPKEESLCGGACHNKSGWHGKLPGSIYKWVKTTTVLDACFNNAADDMAKIDCMKKDGKYKNFRTMGLYRAGIHLPFFEDMFKGAYPADFEAKYMDFQFGGPDSTKKPMMPIPDDNLAGERLDEETFHKAINLFVEVNATKKFDHYLEFPDGSDEVCETNITDDMKSHIENLKFNGWGTRLLTDPTMNFHACNYSPNDFVGSSYKQVLQNSVDKCFTPEIIAQNPNLSNLFNTWESEMSESWSNVLSDQGKTVSQNIKIISDLSGCGSTYWMRSSPDGRYVGNGYTSEYINGSNCSLDPTAKGFFMDLKYNKLIGTNAQYDPGFFPDNKGFTFIVGQSPHFCTMEGLNPGASSSAEVPSFLNIEAGKFCGSTNIGVYQHVGASVDPSKPQYVVVRSEFYNNDDGGQNQENRSDANLKSFQASAEVELYRMCDKNKCNQGANAGVVPQNSQVTGEASAFGVADVVKIKIPYNGDHGISPSSEFITSRVAKKDGTQLGYALHSFDLDQKTSSEAARVCMRGAKASLSFNERFMVTHHYVDDNEFTKKVDGKVIASSDWQDLNRSRPTDKFESATDPEFLKYVNNTSNIHIADLLTGKDYRVTNMKPGQYALYPHFRADGWLYFMVRDLNKGIHFAVASDVALKLEIDSIQ